jgi:hypothetical protein
VPGAACTHALQPYFRTTRIAGVDGALKPTNINTQQTIYIVRHAEAHPDPAFAFEDGNYVAAGQWRALALANALRGKISPNMVYSIDPAQWYPTGVLNASYIRPSLTVQPYAIANKLPFHLAASFSLMGATGIATDPVVAENTRDFFFTGGRFSHQTVLLAWESGHIRPLINALLSSYGGSDLSLLSTDGQPTGGWPHTDYDTIWTVTLDAQGNVTVDNALCEGIDSAQLPVSAPQF